LEYYSDIDIEDNNVETKVNNKNKKQLQQHYLETSEESTTHNYVIYLVKHRTVDTSYASVSKCVQTYQVESNNFKYKGSWDFI